MRFVWFSPPPNPNTPEQPSSAAPAETLAVNSQPAEHEKVLQEYLRMQQLDKLTPIESKEQQEFLKKLEEWDMQGDVTALRTAGRTQPEDLNDGLRKHILLSSAFLERVQGSSLRFKVDFKGNQTAYWKVGAGDIMPPSVHKIKVIKPDGEVFEGTRGFHPQTRRIGYFTADGSYIPVFSGDEIEVVETISNPSVAARKTMSEHVEIYQNGAADDTASVGAETLYDAPTRTRFEDEETARAYHRDRIQAETQEMLQGLQGQVGESTRPKSKYSMEINGQRYGKYSRKEWREMCGNNPNSAERWIVRRDPVTGGPIEFMGNRIGGGINMAMLPYVKEAEERVEQAVASGNMMAYRFKDISSFNWRPIRGGNVASYHSWGVAIDLNSGTNGMGTQGDIPPPVVQVFESLGFVWGGRWQGARRDPMHFELRIDPFAGKNLLKGKGLQYWNALEPRMTALMPRRQGGGATRPSSAPTASAGRQAPQSAESIPSGQNIANRKTNNPETMAQDHAHNAEFMKLSDSPAYKTQINQFRTKALANRGRYEAVAARAGLPWTVIAAIHYRESSFNFNTYLHNGDPLGRPTTHVPKGRMFKDWESAAVDAIRSKGNIMSRLGINSGTTDMGKLLAYAESYNGIGYRLNKNKTSPYVYAGTNIYQGGMFVRDHVFSATAMDKRLGVAACILALQNA